MASFNKVILCRKSHPRPGIALHAQRHGHRPPRHRLNRNWKSETGEMKEEVTFVDVDAFGKTAETIGQYLKKGRPILIEGRLRYDTWEDKQTKQKKSKLGVVLENFQFLDSGGGRGEGAPKPRFAPGRRRPPRPKPADAERAARKRRRSILISPRRKIFLSPVTRHLSLYED